MCTWFADSVGFRTRNIGLGRSISLQTRHENERFRQTQQSVKFYCKYQEPCSKTFENFVRRIYQIQTVEKWFRTAFPTAHKIKSEPLKMLQRLSKSAKYRNNCNKAVHKAQCNKHNVSQNWTDCASYWLWIECDWKRPFLDRNKAKNVHFRYLKTIVLYVRFSFSHCRAAKLQNRTCHWGKARTLRFCQYLGRVRLTNGQTGIQIEDCDWDLVWSENEQSNVSVVINSKI